MDSGGSDGGKSLVVAAGHAATTSGRGAVGSTPTAAARRAWFATYARVADHVRGPGGTLPPTPPKLPAATGSASAAPASTSTSKATGAGGGAPSLKFQRVGQFVINMHQSAPDTVESLFDWL